MNDSPYKEAFRPRAALREDLNAIKAELRIVERPISLWENRFARADHSSGSVMVGGDAAVKAEKAVAHVAG